MVDRDSSTFEFVIGSCDSEGKEILLLFIFVTVLKTRLSSDWYRETSGRKSSRFFANPRKLSFHRTYLSRLAKFSICLKFVVKFKASRTCLVSSLIPLLDRFSTVFYCKLYIVLLENT